jgi:hypothetical protein
MSGNLPEDTYEVCTVMRCGVKPPIIERRGTMEEVSATNNNEDEAGGRGQRTGNKSPSIRSPSGIMTLRRVKVKGVL